MSAASTLPPSAAGPASDGTASTDGAAVMVRDVARRFGETEALRGVSFDVAPGELFGLIGPDGAGKTTLFRILATLLAADAGEARVLGMDVVRDLWKLRARIGYMPGRFSLYPDLSVLENLRFFASVFGTTVEAHRALIDPIYRQIEPFSDRRASALSGGMKQKLALCCALVHRPDILLLDEPTTGVDAVSRREFWELLGELRAGGLTILVSTPYMDEATRCDRVALIQGGRLLDVDSPAAIGARYPLPLLAVRGDDRHALLGALRRFPHARSVYPFGAELHYTDARAEGSAATIAGELAAWLGAEGHPDAAAEPIAAGIEDSFMELMGAAAAEGAP
ncbi:MAG TPA: ABC transporter ATP-binding protein [Longimicrobium sp.]|nr:ABC transporter ATP-binding protein [Longimicrobium sp.]